jgi:hypothetical protein
MDDGEVLYRNRRAWRVRLVQVTVWIAAAIIFELARHAGENPRDTTADIVVAWGGAAFLAACVAGMELYQRLYVLEIRKVGPMLRFTTLATVHHRHVLVEPEDMTLNYVTLHSEITAMSTHHADLHVRGRRFQFIVDLTDDAANIPAIEALIEDAERQRLRRM